jgi:Zn-dependent peptidase ImmA (M78 family)
MDLKSRKKIEEKAQQIIDSLFITEIPIPIDRIANELGINIKPYDLGEDISGVLVINNGKGTIGLNPTESNVRQRFSIAHELGHFVLHKENNDSLFVDKSYKIHFRNQESSTGEVRMEQEANAFAAAILMPKKELKSKIDELEIDLTEDAIKRLAQMFNVSAISMTYRISNLELL